MVYAHIRNCANIMMRTLLCATYIMRKGFSTIKLLARSGSHAPMTGHNRPRGKCLVQLIRSSTAAPPDRKLPRSEGWLHEYIVHDYMQKRYRESVSTSGPGR